jgi:hypothetical protein
MALAAGDVKEGLDMIVSMVGMGSMQGVVLEASGAPARAVTMNAELVGPPMPQATSRSVRATRPDEQGRFTMANLAPGLYKITALSGGVTLRPDGNLSSIDSAAQTLWATAEVSINGEQVSGVTLVLQEGMTLTGRFVAAGASTRVASWAGSRVSLLEAHRPGSVARQAPVEADGTFRVDGIQPGQYELSISLPEPLAATRVVGAVTYQGRELRDTPLTFGAGSINDVRVSVTDLHTNVTGTLTSAEGAPAADYFIVLFPDDPALWHPHSPRVRVDRPGADGAFTLADLLPGGYRIAAVTDVEGEEWREREFLQSLVAESVRLTLVEGQTIRQDLRLR